MLSEVTINVLLYLPDSTFINSVPVLSINVIINKIYFLINIFREAIEQIYEKIKITPTKLNLNKSFFT